MNDDQGIRGQYDDSNRAFLQAFMADPEIRLVALPLVPEEEAAIVAALISTTLPFPHNRTIQDEIAARAAELPERDAVVAGKARLTYGELDRAVLAAYGWTDIDVACEFIGAPVRMRWSQAVQDEVLARLLDLNHRSAGAR